MILPENIFQERINTFKTEEKKLKTKIENWTIIRGIAFLMMLVATYLTSNYVGNLFAIVVFITCFGLFLILVTKHLNFKKELKICKLFQKINKFELNRLVNNFSELPTGKEYIENEHPYLADLDLFGNQSLFQLLNRTHTHSGGILLSNWMKIASSKTEILNRQMASTELVNKLEFRQNFEVLSLFSDKITTPTAPILEWLQSLEDTKIAKPIFKYGKYLPIITFLVLLGAIGGLYTYYFVALFVLFQGIVLKMIDEEISNALTKTEPISVILSSFSEMIKSISDENFENTQLSNLKEKVNGASQKVIELQKIIHFLSYRSNPVAALGSMIFMLDLHNYSKLEKWKAENKDKLPIWLNTINEFEALNSLAAFEFANPNYIKPKIENQSNILLANQLGHPIIPKSKRVYNDFKLDKIGKTIILTGSNMSGKSTFERTVGVNIVLALMGANVCAKDFQCAQLQLFTSMRTQDSLENDTSSFYAELKRLEKLIFLTKNNLEEKPIFYLLDEILKGTNSKDRHSGAKALILQLEKCFSSGIISTHDVELGDEFEGKPFIENYSFTSEMKNNDLIFDYKLKKGVCHSFNASELMRRIGIENI